MFTAGDIASGQSAQQYNQNLGLLGARIAGQRQLQGDAHNYKMDEMTLGANLNMQTLREQKELMTEAQRAQFDMYDDILKNRFGLDEQTRATIIFPLLFGGKDNKSKTEARDWKGAEIISKQLEAINKTIAENPENKELIARLEPERQAYQNILLSYYKNGEQTGDIEETARSDYYVALSLIKDMLQENYDNYKAGNPAYTEEQAKEILKRKGFNVDAINDADWDVYFPKKGTPTNREKRQSGDWYVTGTP